MPKRWSNPYRHAVHNPAPSLLAQNWILYFSGRIGMTSRSACTKAWYPKRAKGCRFNSLPSHLLAGCCAAGNASMPPEAAGNLSHLQSGAAAHQYTAEGKLLAERDPASEWPAHALSQTNFCCCAGCGSGLSQSKSQPWPNRLLDA